MLAVARLIGRKNMVERPIFADDDDDVLDRALGLAIVGVGSADRAVAGRETVASHERQDGCGDDGAIA